MHPSFRFNDRTRIRPEDVLLAQTCGFLPPLPALSLLFQAAG